jgi:ketopantoate reductase
MKIAFIGIGALSGYFEGMLARVGNDVIFIARGATGFMVDAPDQIQPVPRKAFEIQSPY